MSIFSVSVISRISTQLREMSCCCGGGDGDNNEHRSTDETDYGKFSWIDSIYYFGSLQLHIVSYNDELNELDEAFDRWVVTSCSVFEFFSFINKYNLISLFIHDYGKIMCIW